MTELELAQRQITLTKQWLWSLNNHSAEELGLPNWLSKQEAIDEALERLFNLIQKVKRLKNEK